MTSSTSFSYSSSSSSLGNLSALAPLLFSIPLLVISWMSVGRKLVFEFFLILNTLIWNVCLQLCCISNLELCFPTKRLNQTFFLFFAGSAVIILPVEKLRLKSHRSRLAIKLILIQIISLLVVLDAGKRGLLILFFGVLIAVFNVIAWLFRSYTAAAAYQIFPTDTIYSLYIFVATVAFYILLETDPTLNWIIHSLWLIYIFLSGYALLRTRRKREVFIINDPL